MGSKRKRAKSRKRAPPVTSKRTGRILKPQWKKYKRLRRIDNRLFVFFGHSTSKGRAQKRVETEKKTSHIIVTHSRVMPRSQEHPRKGFDIWLRYGPTKTSKGTSIGTIRRFNNKVYLLDRKALNKTDALKKENYLRSRGYNVRTVKDGSMYALYTRKDRPQKL